MSKIAQAPIESRWGQLRVAIRPCHEWAERATEECDLERAPVGATSLLFVGTHFCRMSRAEAILDWARSIPGFVCRGRATIVLDVHVPASVAGTR